MNRHKTFKEREYQDQFDRALKLIAQAKIEQPAVCELADVFPDAFSLACRDLWGRWQMSVETGEWVAFKAVPFEPVVKDDTAKLDNILSGAEILEVDAIGVPDPATQATIEDNGGWGPMDTTAGGWGDTGSTEPVDFSGGDWGIGGDTTTTWGQQEPEWNFTEEHHSLTTYYSAVPETHILVRVEMSIRKVVSVDGPLPNAVSEFRRPVGVVVLAPWPEPGTKPDTYIQAPKMLKDDASEAVSIPAHDPAKDRIRVYVDPATVERLKDRIGMGFNGYWMQVAQKQTSDEPDVPEVEPVEVKGRTKKEQKDSPTNWWYCEDTFQVLQSYWTE